MVEIRSKSEMHMEAVIAEFCDELGGRHLVELRDGLGGHE